MPFDLEPRLHEQIPGYEEEMRRSAGSKDPVISVLQIVAMGLVICLAVLLVYRCL